MKENNIEYYDAWKAALFYTKYIFPFIIKKEIILVIFGTRVKSNFHILQQINYF